MKTSTLALVVLLTAALLRAEEEKKVETEVTVQVAKVIKATLHRTVTCFGTVEPEPTASAKLSPALAGIITEINGVEGRQVKKGDVLFKLDSRAVDAAVAKAELAIKFAQTNVDRQKKLIAAEGTSEKQVLEAEQALAGAKAEVATAKVQQSLLRGEAPMSGTLVMFDAKPGEAADATKALAEIVDLDRLVASVRVPRAEAGALKTGQSVKVSTAGGEQAFESSIAFISPQVDAVSDTVLVRASVPKGGGVRPGAFVTARIVVEERKDRLAVPLAAVYTDNDGKSTLSIVDGDMAKRKEVKIGLRDGGLIEVEGEGLNEGATVVTLGSYALPEETKVRIVETAAKEGAK